MKRYVYGVHARGGRKDSPAYIQSDCRRAYSTAAVVVVVVAVVVY